jgi:hypothetical protein
MSMVLELPTAYRDVSSDELDDIEGGIGVPAVLGIITAAIGIGGSLYAGGRVAGERAYYAGLRNKTYQKIKWQVRAGVAGITPVGSPFIMSGFENKFYSMI